MTRLQALKEAEELLARIEAKFRIVSSPTLQNRIDALVHIAEFLLADSNELMSVNMSESQADPTGPK